MKCSTPTCPERDKCPYYVERNGEIFLWTIENGNFSCTGINNNSQPFPNYDYFQNLMDIVNGKKQS